MAITHVRAAQEYATTDDPVGRAVLFAICQDIGHDNSAAYPSYRTIAKRTGYHYNTVSSWVSKLVDCGDLTMEKKGKRQYYNIPFVAEPETLSHPGYDKQCDNGCDKRYDNLVVMIKQLSQQIEILSQHTASIVTTNRNIVTPLDVTEEEDKREEEDNYNSGGHIFALYQDNIGNLTKIISDDLGDLIDDYSAAWVEDAIRTAVAAEKRNLRYVTGILKNWRRDGRGGRAEKNGSDNFAKEFEYMEGGAF